MDAGERGVPALAGAHDGACGEGVPCDATERGEPELKRPTLGDVLKEMCWGPPSLATLYGAYVTDADRQECRRRRSRLRYGGRKGRSASRWLRERGMLR